MLLEVRTRDEAGNVERWAVDWASACTLVSDRISVFTLKPGDQVRIAGAASRNPALHLMWARSIVRPADRWTWSVFEG